jgi:hypothetical protein
LAKPVIRLNVIYGEYRRFYPALARAVLKYVCSATSILPSRGADEEFVSRN